ncbi:N-acetylmuramoyl-L-alanine amidase family protein [Butyrivibrio sp. MC2021]|uniref:N-acetylmuramoyl-L-alanine amidase family protein n=1 Tax=Butyrivibrio sp. MC2021 TaxID=1408306 RepID=UPI000479BFD8|nr:N-acetylmuramoyl-L-alanine amidase [Butyrivibrio sp. MC2021]
MDNGHMKKMVIRASVFTVLSLAVMLQRSATKHIMITDAAGGQVDIGNDSDTFRLPISSAVQKGKENVLVIPLPKSVSSDDIVLEDRYIDHELLININSREEGFYLDTPVVTGLDTIESAVCICENGTGNVCLDFKMDGLYANESLLTDQGTIEVSFFEPREKYDRIVVVDPVGGGSDSGAAAYDVCEKDIALSVAKELKNVAEKDVGVRTKLYFTRLEDEEVSPERRLEFLDETKADLFIRIGVGASNDSDEFGVMTEYNDRFFLRDMSNAKFADVLEKSCVSAMNCNAAGCIPSQDEILQGCDIPSARVNVGFLTNEIDKTNMPQSAYAKKAAQGIYVGIIQAFKEIE